MLKLLCVNQFAQSLFCVDVVGFLFSPYFQVPLCIKILGLLVHVLLQHDERGTLKVGRSIDRRATGGEFLDIFKAVLFPVH